MSAKDIVGETICFATSNDHKLGEVREILREVLPDLKVIGLAEAGGADGPEPVEDGVTFAENARIKARAYGERTGVPTLADDSGLVVDCLNGAPGLRSARYADTNEDRIARVIREAEAIGAFTRLDHKPAARFVAAVALWLPGSGLPETGQFIEAEGTIEGQLLASPRGEGGFGYDPIVYIPELACSVAELTPAQKNERSHRGNALRALAAKLA